MAGDCRRREFCARVWRAATMSLVPGGAACGRGPTGPTDLASPPPGASPAPAPPPPSSPTPPPTSSTVEALPVVPATAVAGGFTVAVDAASPLAATWGSARTQLARDGFVHDVLLMRVDSGTVVALKGVCTHEGCVVTRVARPVFVCPCHGSRYDHTGAVVRGPAPAPLPGLATEFSGTILTVRL